MAPWVSQSLATTGLFSDSEFCFHLDGKQALGEMRDKEHGPSPAVHQPEHKTCAGPPQPLAELTLRKTLGEQPTFSIYRVANGGPGTAE